MNPVLRMLEEWTTHQDYLWFLAVLAWAGVIAAEFRGGERQSGSRVMHGWLVVLAVSGIIGALLELVLLAQHLMSPYTRFDLAMGAAQALGTGALLWPATAGIHGRGLMRGFGSLVLLGLAAARFKWPVEAGVVLCVAQLAALGTMLRRRSHALPVTVMVFFALTPIVATHGPWAYAAGLGRANADWSYFALIAAATAMAGPAILAATMWRQRLREALPDSNSEAENKLRRDLRFWVAALAVWLVCGVLIAIWYGRQARRGYEDNLVRRTEIMVMALDPAMVAEALGPDLRIESIQRRRYPDGSPVDVAIVPQTTRPVYHALRQRLAELHAKNPDLRFLQITTWRQGQLLVAIGSAPRKEDSVRHVIRRGFESEDLQRLAARSSLVEGPFLTQWGAQLGVRVPLFHPETNLLLGWLNAEVDATRWAVTFTQARLQTMTLVGVGVGLWILAVAYRLRRETRDAAEQKAAAAAAADRMKSAFLAKVSHELRTPIQSVLGYGELLESAALPDAHRSWLAALRSHGDIMLRLVNDLIDLGALQSGAFQLAPRVVSLRTLLDECAAALRPAANAKGLLFQTEFDADLPAWVLADDVRLRQILLNLLNNAVKFTAVGRVTFLARRLDNGHFQFVVADTGAGIPPALRPRLFQPFARLDSTVGGSGLGLALVQGLCGVMGGGVRLADGSQGSTFIVELPLPLAESAPSTATVVELPRGKASEVTGLRVLVAEDNTLVRELLVAFLTENGADVIVAADGPTALALAREGVADVMLLDIGLPKLDGLKVAEILRAEGLRKLRIVGLSAQVSANDEAKARKAGMDAFLGKPVRLATLAAVIGEQMRDSRGRGGTAPHIGDAKLRARLWAQFVTETPGVLSEMRAALAAGDWPRLRGRAHYLKNSADVLGAERLQAACHRLAVLEQAPSQPVAQQLLEGIEAAVPAEEGILADVPAADKLSST